MCVCLERERERTVSFPRPAHPKIHLSVLQTVCVRIFRSVTGLFSLFCLWLLFFFYWWFVLWMHHQSIKTNKCQRAIFLIYIFKEQPTAFFSGPLLRYTVMLLGS